MQTFKQAFHLLRFSHWSKAAFVLIGVLYSKSFLFFPKALVAALAFSLLASAVYIYNDFMDREQDKLHPEKCNRPLASGEMSIQFALFLLILLLIGGLLLGFLISDKLALILCCYLVVNLAYNHFLKNIPVLDVLCIASGFMLRVLAGTIGIGLYISSWLTVSATLMSLFIALCKRRLEKELRLNYDTRAVLKKYSTTTLDFFILISALITFLSYFLYILYARDESFYFLLTLPFAGIGLWRFARLTVNSPTQDDPINLFLNDRFSRINLFSFLLLTIVALSK